MLAEEQLEKQGGDGIKKNSIMFLIFGVSSNVRNPLSPGNAQLIGKCGGFEYYTLLSRIERWEIKAVVVEETESQVTNPRGRAEPCGPAY